MKKLLFVPFDQKDFLKCVHSESVTCGYCNPYIHGAAGTSTANKMTPLESEIFDTLLQFGIVTKEFKHHSSLVRALAEILK